MHTIQGSGLLNRIDLGSNGLDLQYISLYLKNTLSHFLHVRIFAKEKKILEPFVWSLHKERGHLYKAPWQGSLNPRIGL